MKEKILAKAIELFAKEGEEGVKVDTIIKSLGISKGGFYHHFKSRHELLDKIIDYWFQTYTDVIRNNSIIISLPPKQRLLTISTLIIEQKIYKYDVVFRAWALKNSEVAERVNKVFELRLEFIRNTFKELGFIETELEMRTRLYMTYEANEGAMYTNVPNDERHLWREARIKMLCQLESQV